MATKVKEYGEVLTFFVLETLAFTAFTLGNSIWLYALFGLLTLVMIILFNFNRLKDLDWTYYFVFMIPFVIFAALSGFNKFTLDQEATRFDLLTNLCTCLSLLIFVSIGFLSKTIKNFKITTAMMTIYGGLTVITLIGLVYGMIKYVPCYTMIYEGYYMYYEGARVPVWDSIPFLMGFEFFDIKITYFNLFATMLFTSVVGLRYVSPKKETKKFIFYCIFASVGLLAMIFTINKVNIITSFLVILFLLFLTFVPKNGKILKPIFYTILGIVVLLGIVFFINAQSTWGFAKPLQEAIAGNHLLNRLFNSNRLSAPMKEILDRSLQIKWLSVRLTGNEIITSFKPSGVFIIDAIMYSGTLGGMMLTIFLIFVFANTIKYYKSDRDDIFTKNLIVGFVGSFFLYAFISFESQPYARYDNYLPLQQNAIFLITLFLIGYMFQGNKKKEEALKLALTSEDASEENNEIQSNENEIIVEEDKEESNDEEVAI